MNLYSKIILISNFIIFCRLSAPLIIVKLGTLHVIKDIIQSSITLKEENFNKLEVRYNNNTHCDQCKTGDDHQSSSLPNQAKKNTRYQLLDKISHYTQDISYNMRYQTVCNT